MHKTIILIVAMLPISAIACNNDCWISLNQDALNRVIQAHKATKLQSILDKICEQGRPITKRERKLAKRLHLKKCGHTPNIPNETPTPNPSATQRPTPSPTPAPSPVSPTPTPRPSPTPTSSPSVSPTPTPSASPTPSISPTPSPTCTPQGQCTFSTIEWEAQYPNWPDEAFPLQLGNHSYTKEQSFDILSYPGDAGDDLSRLCREMVAAMLNIVNGSPHDCADTFIHDANELIGDLVPRPVGDDTHVPTPESTNLIFQLTNYNKGNLCCASHCPTP